MAAEQCLLLRCLAQLNDDVWAQLLLPKLVADKSAASVALTCSTLRQLCQRSVQKLDLTALSSTDPLAVRQWTEPLPERFPACSSIMIRTCQKSIIIIPTILDALARMPHLSSLACKVTLGQQPMAVAMAISSISSRLPQLRELVLNCRDSWQGAQVVWDQLGAATQLTYLKVSFAKGVSRGYTLDNLAPLRALSGLQRLTIKRCQQQQGGGHQQQQDGGSFAFLGALPALTRLVISVPSANGLSSISSCTALREMQLHTVNLHAPSDAGRLSAADWEAMGQLARLSELHIGLHQQPADLLQGQQPFYAALENLTLLQTVSAGCWTPAVLPVLAALPELRCVLGNWVSGGVVAGVVCQHVTRLGRAAFTPPFESFPNLEIIWPAGWMDAAAWHSMSSCCPKLREFCSVVYAGSVGHVPEFPQWHSFDPSTPDVVRMSAIRSLCQLTALTKLSFHATHAMEVAAVADAVPAVRELHICMFTDRLECAALLPLAKLTSLTCLGLHLRGYPHRTLDAQLLLSALSHVPKVLLAGPSRCIAVFNEAVREIQRLGLTLPAGLRVVAR